MEAGWGAVTRAACGTLAHERGLEGPDAEGEALADSEAAGCMAGAVWSAVGGLAAAVLEPSVEAGEPSFCFTADSSDRISQRRSGSASAVERRFCPDNS